MEAPGGYGKVYYKSVHDPCKVRAAVFDDGKQRVAIVGLDAIGIRRDTVLKVREADRGADGDTGGFDPDQRIALAFVGALRSWIMPEDYDACFGAGASGWLTRSRPAWI